MIRACKYYLYRSGCVYAWKYELKDLVRNQVKATCDV